MDKEGKELIAQLAATILSGCNVPTAPSNQLALAHDAVSIACEICAEIDRRFPVTSHQITLNFPVPVNTP